MDPVIGLTIFVLSLFIGFEIITKIPPTLHTPLMSGSNAISGITVVGAILAGQGWLGTTRAGGRCEGLAGRGRRSRAAL